MNDDYFGCHCVSRGIACFQLLLIVISQNNNMLTIFKWHKTVKRETLINKKPHVKLLIVCSDVIVKSSWCRLLCFSHAIQPEAGNFVFFIALRTDHRQEI